MSSGPSISTLILDGVAWVEPFRLHLKKQLPSHHSQGPGPRMPLRHVVLGRAAAGRSLFQAESQEKYAENLEI